MRIVFSSINLGHLLPTNKFNLQEEVHSSLHPLSLSGFKNEVAFREISIYQSGFREELLPARFEAKVKEEIKFVIRNYVEKLMNTSETDLIKCPQQWIYIRIKHHEAEVKVREFR